jgi:tyramine---L-glutamate ligase
LGTVRGFDPANVVAWRGTGELFRGREAARRRRVAENVSSGSAECESRIVQEYVSGFAASVAFLCGPRTFVPLIPCAQYLSTDGRFQYLGGRLPIARNLAERAIRIATAAIRCVPGLAGYVGVDVVLGDDGRDWAIEINPRLTTSYVGLRALAKFNIAEAMLAVVRGESLPTLEWREGVIAFTSEGQISPLVA